MRAQILETFQKHPTLRDIYFSVIEILRLRESNELTLSSTLLHLHFENPLRILIIIFYTVWINYYYTNSRIDFQIQFLQSNNFLSTTRRINNFYKFNLLLIFTSSRCCVMRYYFLFLFFFLSFSMEINKEFIPIFTTVKTTIYRVYDINHLWLFN